jgi:leucyl aminopeptidase
MDITEYPELDAHARTFNDVTVKVKYPASPANHKAVKPLLAKLEQQQMKDNLVKFSGFYTRYYKSKYGAESSKWLQSKVQEAVTAAGADKHGTTVRAFDHPWGQSSVIAHIPGRTNTTVVIGAHQDSINMFLPDFMPAPGADDDGSGTVTILEALRVLLQDPAVRDGQAPNTVEFHWYSAEEGGLLGSQAVFTAYRKDDRDVRAMLQQDMTGYVAKTVAAGKPESLGVITDFVDPGLTEFVKSVVTDYCDIPYVLTKCGYACSDHASASKAGYPSAFVIESDFQYSSSNIHTDRDRVDDLSFPHMLQHAKLTLGLAYELAFANLTREG